MITTGATLGWVGGKEDRIDPDGLAARTDTEFSKCSVSLQPLAYTPAPTDGLVVLVSANNYFTTAVVKKVLR